MRGQKDLGTVVQQVLEGGDGSADAGVVADGASGLVERHVEVCKANAGDLLSEWGYRESWALRSLSMSSPARTKTRFPSRSAFLRSPTDTLEAWTTTALRLMRWASWGAAA